MEFMNETDLRDCFAMFIVNGLISRASVFDMKEVWEMADAMLEARNKDNNEELGIAAVKPKRKYLRGGSR
jgi:hypothetical protein